MLRDSNSLTTRISNGLPKLWLPLVVVLCAAYTWRPLTGGDDVWAHAAIGRWMVENSAVPRMSLFLWGAPPQEWVYHSWLSQLTFYALLWPGETVGAAFLLAFSAVVVVAVFVLLWRLWTLRAGAVSVWMPPIFVLALYCSSLRFRPRPELFSALFLTLLLLFLLRDRHESDGTQDNSRKGRHVLAAEALAIAALFALWANFHGGVAIGLVLMGVTAVLELFQQRFARRSWKWLLLFAVAVLAVFINPYGIEYWQALRPVGGEMFKRIDEWKPFWKAPILNPTMIAGEFMLAWLAFLFWAGNPRRRWSQLGWVVVMVVLFVTARRYLWLLPLVCLAVMAANAQTLTAFQASSLLLQKALTPAIRLQARALATAVLAFAVIFAISPQRLARGPVASSLPQSAAEYFTSHNLAERGGVFNDYENSSYLQWRFGGEPPLFIDLLNAYPDQLLLDYLDIANARQRGRALLEERKFQVVILRSHKSNSPLAKLAKYLNDDARWQRVYSAGDGMIWLRRPQPAATSVIGEP